VILGVQGRQEHSSSHTLGLEKPSAGQICIKGETSQKRHRQKRTRFEKRWHVLPRRRPFGSMTVR